MSDYNLGTASGKIEVDGKGAAVGFKVAKSAAGSFFSVVDAKVKSVQSLGRKMAAVGTAGTVGFGIAIKAAADFQQQLSGVQAVTGSTGDEMESLRKLALKLGADTVFSAGEAANAIEELAKAGIPVADILNGAADAAVALAAAGGVSIPEAATIAANAMNMFSLSAKEVPKIADVLAGVANTSASDVSGLGQSLAQAGAVANLAGLSFRDTAIALGEMADAGIKGSDAGTSVKTMLNNLIPTTTKQIAEFERLHLLTFDNAKAMQTLRENGITPLGKDTKTLWGQMDKLGATLSDSEVGSAKAAKAAQTLAMRTGALSNAFFDAKGNIKDLSGLQDTLHTALNGMTKQQKLSTLEILFGADAMRASAILSLEGKKGYEEFSKAVSKTSAADVAKVRLDNLAGSVEQFKGSLQTAEITIGAIFLPIITKIFDGLTKLLNVFNSLPKPIQVGIGIFLAISSAGLLVVGMILALLPVIIGMIANFILMRGLSFVFTFFRVLVTEAAAGTLSLQVIGTEAKIAGASFLKMGKMMVVAGKLMLFAGKMIRLLGLALKFAFTNPYILAIIALIALGVLLYKKWKPFHDLVDKIAHALVDGFNKAKAVVIPFFLGALEAVKKFGTYIKATIGPVIKAFVDKVLVKLAKQWDKIKAAISKNLMPALHDLAAVFNGDIVPAFHAVMKAVSPLAKAVGGALGKAFSFAYKVISWLVKLIVGKLIPIFIQIYGKYLLLMIREFGNLLVGVIKVISGIINIITGFIKIFKGIFTGDWSLVLEGAKQVLKGFFTFLTAMFVAGLKLPLKLLGKFLGALKDLFMKGFHALFGGGGGGAGPLTPLVKVFTKTFEVITGIITGALDVILGIWNAVWGVFGPVVTAVFKLIMAIIKLYFTIWKVIILTALWAIKTAFSTIWNAIQKVVTVVLGLIMSFLKREAAGLQRIFGPPLQFILNLFKTVFNAIKGPVQSAISFVKGVVSGGMNAIKGFVSSRMAAVKSAWTSAWNAVGDFIGTIWGRIKTGVSNGISAIKTQIGNLKDSILNPIKDLANLMYHAGVEMMKQLLGGITSMVSSITDKIGSVTSKIGGLIPGSPVKEGALRVLNHGHSGREMMKMLQYGINKEKGRTIKSAENAAKAISRAFGTNMSLDGAAINGMVSATGGGGAVRGLASGQGLRRIRHKKGGGGQKSSRLVSGRLTLDPSGRAFIRGIAEDAVHDNGDYGNTLSRMGD